MFERKGVRNRAATALVVGIAMVCAALLLRPGTRAANASAGPYGSGAPITVFAASSLTESLQRVAVAWTAHGGGTVTFSFDASSRLARQIEAGAPADVFVSADTAWVDWLDGRVAVASRADLLGNTLVAVVRADAPVVPGGPADLVDPALKRLALAGENVPAGAYARAALRSTGAWAAVGGRVVSGDSVRTALGWVASGEADVGIVYRTDVRVEPAVREAFAFAPGTHPPIVYRGAVLAGRAATADAAAFLAFCASPEAQAIFTTAGFTPLAAMTHPTAAPAR